MPDEKEKLETASVQFTPTMKQWLLDRADEEGTSLSHIVRTAVRNEMKRIAAETENG